MLSNGDKIGHYRIDTSIGCGGMGEIYLASDTRLRRNVAIKILPLKLIQDSQAVERFMREARAVSTLNHPNILTIYDIGDEEKIKYIATEFVEGKTLRQQMTEKFLRLPEVISIAIQITSALAAAHQNGIVHRDIKPENIMLRDDGYIKVLDFGIAKLTELSSTVSDEAATLVQTTTIPGMILGTVSYMSPEQARGLEVDGRSDIFSLGTVIYEMLTQKLPFEGATISDIIASILKTEPKPLSETITNIPPEFESVIFKTLSKDKERRYQTAEDLLNDLKQLQQRLDFETEIHRVSKVNVNIDFAENPTQQFSKNQISNRKPRVRKAIDSLAVLPFVNASKDANAEYLSDGITEGVINSLSKLPKFRVVPRSTVFRYKGQDDDLQKIGQELGVRAVLAGRVLQVGNSLIVKTELVDIANEAQIWGEQYRRELTDIFVLLDEITEEISGKLKLKLSGEEKKQLAKRYTENTEAYQFYLKGRYFVTTKRTEEWIKKGIEYFQMAIDLDPNYALAYAGMAEAYGLLASSTGGWSPHKAYPKAKAAALKALELDETLGEAHCSLGFFYLLYDWDLSSAEREFRRAISLSPNYSNAHDGYGFFLKASGRHKEAIEKGKTVQKLEPLSPFAHVTLGYAYYFARNFEKAIEECNKALELDGKSSFAYRNLGLAYLQLGKFDEAIQALNYAIKFSDGGLAFESYLGFAYAKAGIKDEALRVLENMYILDREKYVPAYNFAIIYAGLNDFDKAFEWLEKAFQERSGFLPFLKVEPMADGLRNNLYFQNLLERISSTQ